MDRRAKGNLRHLAGRFGIYKFSSFGLFVLYCSQLAILNIVSFVEFLCLPYYNTLPPSAFLASFLSGSHIICYPFVVSA